MKSAISWWLFGPILLIVVISGYVKFSEDPHSIWISIGVILFISLILVSTKYTIYSDGTLKVISGFIPFPKVNLNEVTAVVYTRNPISSPALSLNRLALYKGNSLLIIISPKNREAFIAEMKKFNDSLSVVLR
jgi:Bacterial PH domain